jgi:hypothetical protein
MSSGISHDPRHQSLPRLAETARMIATGDAKLPAIRAHAGAWLLLLLCSLAAVLPLLLRGPSCGHDFDFHLLSWIETAHDWHHHLLDPQWLATANYGAGEPRFIFYPPVSWVLGAGFGAAAGLVVGQVEGWTLAPVFISLLAIFGSGLCVYWLAQTLASRRASLAAACLFIANPYLLFVTYERTAYGELLATPLIALLLLLALRKLLSVPLLALVIAALWLTNAPAAVMGCYTLAFISFLRLLKERDWRNAARSAAGCALGLALAGFYLVPAVVEQRWVQINRAINTGMRVQDSFLFRFTGEGYHDQVLRTASILTVLVLGIGLVAFAVISIRKRGAGEPAIAIFGWLLAVILFLQFPASLHLWNAAPHLAFLQFPWRWLLVASILSACLISMALSGIEHAVSFASLTVALAVVAGSIWFCSHRFYLYCDEQDLPAGQLSSFFGGAGVQGTDEYAPVNSDNSAIFQDLPQVRLLTLADAEEPAADAGDNPEWPGYSLGAIDSTPGVIAINNWQPEAKQVTLTTTRPAYAVLALMDYPSWKVTVNGQPVAIRPKRDDGLMTIPIGAGKSTIAVQWTTSRDIWWGRALSLAGLLILLFLIRKTAGTPSHRK